MKAAKQFYGERAMFQLLGWLLVFLGLILTNEITRRSKKGGIFFFLVLAIILKRAIQQKKNPYKNEIFTDTKGFRLAMARAEEKKQWEGWGQPSFPCRAFFCQRQLCRSCIHSIQHIL